METYEEYAKFLDEIYANFPDGTPLTSDCVNMGNGRIRIYTQNDGDLPAEWVDYRVEE